MSATISTVPPATLPPHSSTSSAGTGTGAGAATSAKTPAQQGTPPEELLNALLSVFSAQGFEGASMAQLASASSRSKASLYHHFPGGKQQMIEVLVERCRLALDGLAFDPLRQITTQSRNPGKKNHKTPKRPNSEKGDSTKKALAKELRRDRQAAYNALESFVDGFSDYLSRHDGNCLLATLALTQPQLLGSPQREQLADWLALLARACELAGHKPKAARRLAQASLARLYGSLTLAAMGSHITVGQACNWLKRDLLK